MAGVFGSNLWRLPTSAPDMHPLSKLPVPPSIPVPDNLAKSLAGSMFRSASVDNPYLIGSKRGLGTGIKKDEQQVLGDFLGLLIPLLENNEVRAALVILQSLASSAVADSELTCKQFVFKRDVADVVDTSPSEFSFEVFAFIQQWCNDESKFGSMDEEWETMSAPAKFSTTTPDAKVSMESSPIDSQRRGRSPTRRSQSRKDTLRSIVSPSPEEGEDRQQVAVVQWPRRSQVWYDDREPPAASSSLCRKADLFEADLENDVILEFHASNRHEGTSGASSARISTAHNAGRT